jgi:XXXCH domain-containing protein
MNKKDAEKISKNQLADYLEGLATKVRGGSIEIKGRAFTIADNVSLKVRAKEKKGTIVQKIKFQWSAIGSYSDGEQKKISQWKDSFKTIKKRLSRSFKTLNQTAGENKIPSPADLENFINDSRLFAELAEPEWQEEMQEYMDHLNNLRRAVEQNNLESVVHELQDLKNRMKSCHREYK